MQTLSWPWIPSKVLWQRFVGPGVGLASSLLLIQSILTMSKISLMVEQFCETDLSSNFVQFSATIDSVGTTSNYGHHRMYQ
jgi:hypothetical protein